MKTLITIVTITAALTLPGTGARPRLISPPNPEVQDAVPPEAAADEQLQKAQQEIERAQSKIDRRAAEIEARQAEVEQAAAAAAVAEASVPPVPELPGVSTRLQSIVHRGQGSGKALMIRSSEFDPKEQANLEEDLAVMAHILDKAMEEKVGSQRRAPKAMGIDLYFSSSSAPLRSLYLDGYGAVFMLKVSFPLLPAAKSETRKERTDTSTTWEEARQELYGRSGEGKMMSAPAEEYDEEKVTRLKDALLEGLKNGANIRDLKPDDSVTVCVFGGAGGPAKGLSVAKVGPPRAAVQNQVWVYGEGKSGQTRGTIMTIRVKKSDIDAFAKSKQSLEEFRKKAKVTTYAGNADSGGGLMGFGSGSGSAFEFMH
jgi:hypothetical protein